MDKAKYRVIFYRTAGGKCQACDYAREMDVNHRTKAKRCFQALAELGRDVPSDYGKYLRQGIWELRIVSQYHQHRFLYFFRDDIVLVTNAFLKKSQEVPESEINTALKARSEWTWRFYKEKL